MSVEGEHWDLSTLRGKVGVLNFWATWCEACLAEIPQLSTLARRHDGQLVVLGINYREGEAAIRRFSEGKSLGFPILRDPEGAAFRVWGSGVLPSSVLVSRGGRGRFVIRGEMDWESARTAELLQSLLADKAIP
jgi:thiol-disulfide isomerase/thioredoxin